MTLDNILAEINNANDVIILTHEDPDGDAIGSSLALYLALKQYGKNVDIVIPEYPRLYEFLPGIKEIKKEGKNEKYDLAIALDCTDIKRLNGFSNYFENAKSTVSIDHHDINTMFADFNFVNPDSPACCQILITILEYFNVEITKDIGTCLLAGIITDTGGFKYPKTTVETFEFAAWLLKKGVNVSEIYEKVLQIKSKPNFLLTKLAYERLEFLENDKIAFTYISKQDEKDTMVEKGDYEGIVDIGRVVEGVEVSILLKESENAYKVSLRSNKYVNVSDIALLFGGGGHIRAAGCIISGNIDQIKQKLVSQIKKYLK